MSQVNTKRSTKARRTKKTIRKQKHNRTRVISKSIVELNDDIYLRVQTQLKEVYDIEIEINSNSTPISILEENISVHPSVECHSIVDLGVVVRQYLLWKQLFPRVHPFYAIKAFPNLNIIRVLHLLGVNFDCASAGEIKTVLEIGANPNDVIFANPAKGFSHLEYAKLKGVKKMTFDNKEELKKIHKMFPQAELVLRIAANDSKSLMPFGYKYGCSVEYARELVDECSALGANLFGVSFHVGSGCYDPQAYVDTINSANSLFGYAKENGYDLKFLDLGGGWPGDKASLPLFTQFAEVITPLLDQLFPDDVQIIAEPGRYFCMATTTLAVQIHSKRDYLSFKQAQNDDGSLTLVPQEKEIQYYVTEGCYGCFNNTVWDFQKPTPVPFKEIPKGSPTLISTFFGPTCDSLDVIAKRINFPALEVGDWVYFSDMGAYTLAAASNFNGFEGPRTSYCFIT